MVKQMASSGFLARVSALGVAAVMANAGLPDPGFAQGSANPSPSVKTPNAEAQKEWSGRSGASGHPLMTAEAIRVAAKDFAKCLEGLWPGADARGIPRQTFDAATAGLKPDLQLLDHLDAQAEFKMTLWDYLDIFLGKDRIDRGRDMLTRYRPVLEAIEKTYGVNRHVLVAIWGVETNYGTEMGKWPVLTSTATLACIGRRQKYFRSEFLAALAILDRADVRWDGFVGSWSGAFGQTQFMPTSFEAFAVDFDHLGGPDVLGSVPNALASTANFLKLHGWVPDSPVISEVAVPAKFDFAAADASEPRTNADWTLLGVAGADGKPLTNPTDRASLDMPAGSAGPGFLTFANFGVLLRYNPALSYALAVALLSDRLQGGNPLRHDWPRGERLLSDAERLELQKRLVQRGLDIGGPIDGLVGTGTRQAIRKFQTSVGMVADGFPSSTLYERLGAP